MRNTRLVAKGLLLHVRLSFCYLSEESNYIPAKFHFLAFSNGSFPGDMNISSNRVTHMKPAGRKGGLILAPRLAHLRLKCALAKSPS